MPIWTGDNDLDDDYPPLNRNDVYKIRALLLKIEEAGGINVLTDEEVETLRAVVNVFNLPGVYDMLVAASEEHVTALHWAKVRAKWVKVTKRGSRFLAWFIGGLLSILIGITQFGDALAKIKGWLSW